MKRENLNSGKRGNAISLLESDFVVIGGGMAGVCAHYCCAQGNPGYSETGSPGVGRKRIEQSSGLYILGATSHMGNNNHWSREGGVIDEILVENMYRNKEGNTIILDTILLEKVKNEPNITLLLNAAVFDLEKKDTENIAEVKAFCSQNLTEYILKAPLFCNASGDGIVEYRAGASYRIGAVSSDEFGELFTPSDRYGELFGHTIYFHRKDN